MQLQLANKQLLIVQSGAEGAFIYCGPGLWNKLPTDLRSIITVDIYLKTDSKPFYSPRLTQ